MNDTAAQKRHMGTGEEETNSERNRRSEMIYGIPATPEEMGVSLRQQWLRELADLDREAQELYRKGGRYFFANGQVRTSGEPGMRTVGDVKRHVSRLYAANRRERERIIAKLNDLA